MVGVTNGDQTYETGEYLERAFGTNDPQAPLLHQASPINYITGDEPPFLVLHRLLDYAIPIEQALVFHQKLVDAGVNAILITVTNANHNFKPTGGPITPTREDISKRMADFFDLWLR